MTKNLLPTSSITKNNFATHSTEIVKFHLLGKRILMLTIGICFSLFVNAQVSKTVNLTTAGTLSTALTADELNSVTNLTITGTMDARDFKTMRDNMPLLAVLDLSGATVVAYTGTEGTYTDNTYLANIVPGSAFEGKQSLVSLKLPSSIVSIGNSALWGCSGLTSFNIPTSVTSTGWRFCEGCTKLTSLTIPPSLKDLGYHAFSGCNSLTSVTIPSTVTSIGEAAFYECKNLTNVTILSPTTTIDVWAFGNCFKLTSLTVAWVIPPRLGNYTFGFVNGGLCTLHVPYGKATQYRSDNQWKSFANIVEPENGFSLSAYTAKVASAAGSTSNIEVTANVNWTASSDQSWLTASPSNANGNQTLTFTADDNPLSTVRTAIVTVSSTGFESQTISISQNGSTRTLNLSPGGLASALTPEEFQGITNLILKGTIDATDFKIINNKMPNLKEIDLSEVTIAEYIGTDGPWVDSFGSTSSAYPANTIPKNAFGGFYGAVCHPTSIKLPRVLSAIGDYSFSGPYTSVTVYWPTPLVLDRNLVAFNSLNNCVLHVPYGTASLYKSAERWRYFPQIVEADKGLFVSSYKVNIAGEEGSKATVDIKANVDWTVNSDQDWLIVSPTSGKDNQTITFTAKANPLITNRTAIVTISETGVSSQVINVTQIYQIQPKTLEITAGGLSSALSTDELNTISKLTLTGTIDARDFKTMRDKMPLLVVVDLSGATIVGYTGTEGTSGTSSYTYPANTVPDYSFYKSNSSEGNTRMTTIILPSTVTSIGSSAFRNCSSLTSVTIPASVKNIGYNAFDNCKGLTSVIIPSSVTTIESYAFNNCDGLISVTIPSSVTSIGSSAFFGCNGLTSITIPSSVSQIGSYALGNCWKISSIFANSLLPINLSSSSDVFYDLNKPTITLNVPMGSKAAYQVAEQWKDFIKIVEMPGLFLSVKTLNMGYNAGTANLSIGSSSDWTAVSDQEWLTLSPTSGTIGSSSLTLTATANPNATNRIATITIAAKGFESQTVTINQYPKVDVTAGNLKTVLSDQLSTITNLTVSGTIDARDFKTIRDEMPLLAVVDLSGARVVEYIGTEGTSGTKSYTYPANTVPDNSFYNPNSGQGKVKLTAINLPLSVTSIGNSAFYNCTGLPSFTIPSTVKSIGNSVFYNCTALTSVIFPSSVISIGNSAFYNCSGLTSVDIPASVTSIGNSAFYYCTGLTAISIPSSVKTIRNNTLYGCTGLTSISISSSVSSIEDWAFGFCNKVNSIQASSPLPINLSPSFSVFYGIEKTTTILKVPFGSKAAYQVANEWREFKNIIEMPGLYLWADSIGMGANAGTAKLSLGSSSDWTATSDQQWLTLSPASGTVGASTLTLTATINPDNTNRKATITVSAKGIESKTITVTQYSKVELTAGNLKTLLANKLSSITNLTLTGTIDARDFKTMRDKMPLLTVVDLSRTTIVGYTGPEGTSGSSSYISYTYPANTVPYNSFYSPDFGRGKTTLTTIILPSSATSIGNSAFYNCTGLTSVTIPPSVITIESSVFYNCTGLTSVTIPSSVTFIGNSAFYNCTGLTSVTIPSSVTTIESSVFFNCTRLTSVTIPSSVTTIESSVFYNCIGLKSVSIPSSVTSIKKSAFYNCSGLTSVTIPSSVTAIESAVFYDCTGLTSITIPSSVTTIGNWAFYNCTGLTSVSIPSSVTTIESYVFGQCTGLISVTIPLSVSSIGNYAFHNCSSLTSINIPPSTVSIGSYAFYNCSRIISFTIPSSVATIGSYAFGSNNWVSSMQVNSIVPINISNSPEVFYVMNKIAAILYVPPGTKAAYQAANQWKEFVNVVEMPGLFLSTNSLSMGSNAGTAKISVGSSSDWTATSDQQWLTLSPSSGTVGASTFTLTTTTNPGNTNRIATITVSAKGFKTQTITVTQNSKIDLTAGNLKILLANQLSTITNLTLTGTIDARDFKTMRDDMPLLATLDLSGTTVVGYIGTEGTSGTNSYTYPANAVPDFSFYSNNSNKGKISLKTMILPSAIESIGVWAFSSCSGLTSVVIPPNVSLISSYAFYNCAGLTSMNIPSSVTSIGSSAFGYCNGVSSIQVNSPLPINLSSSSEVFYNINKSTTILKVPIGSKASYQTANQWKDFVNIVEIPGFFISTNSVIMSSNAGIAKISIASSSEWSVVSDRAWLTLNTLSGAIGLSSLTITASANTDTITRVATITVKATGFEPKILTIYQYSGVKVTAGNLETKLATQLSTITQLTLTGTIDARDFKTIRDKMPLLTMLDISGATIAEYTGIDGTSSNTFQNTLYPANTIPENAFYSFNRIILSSITLPPSLTSIGKYAFAYCSSITNMDIPASVTSIGDSAFLYCVGMTAVTIPTTVTTIGATVFMSCNKLTTIKVRCSIPPNLGLHSYVFDGVDKNKCTLYVPYGSKSLYKTADQWKDFTNIVEFNPGTIANAGPDQVINEGQVVTLDGTNSKSINNGILSYKWTAPTGITLSSETTSKPTFIAPEVIAETSFTFSLIINDGSGDSEADDVIIIVKKINKAPLANAGADQSVYENSLVTLDASASADPDNDKLNYLWTAPAGITLSSETASNSTFTAPEVSIDTDYTFELTVNDGSVNSTADQVKVTVKQVNKAPIANAGTNQSVNENSLVTLDGSASLDPDQDELNYLWTAPAGITLSSETAKNPTFTAPEVNQDNIYRFILLVNDGKTDSDTSQVSIIVKQVLPVLKLVSKTSDSQISSTEVTYQFYLKTGNSFSEESVTPVMNGDTTEFSLEPGEWIVLASPTQSSSTFVPTYSGNTLDWINAEHIIIPENGITIKEITCFVPEVANTGTGQITGFVYEKTDTGTKSISMTKTSVASGNPVPGALIRLFKKGNTVPVLSIFTDSQGYYKFDQLEVLDYQIEVEIPGFTQSEKFEIAISADQPSASAYFGVNTTSKVITDTYELLSSSLKIYPNPVVRFVTVEVGRSNIIPYSILVYSIHGELMINQAAIDTKTILDLSRLLAGSYLIQVCSGADRQSSIVIKK
jgi:hypothetical protein